MSDDETRHPHLRLVPGAKDGGNEPSEGAAEAFIAPGEERRGWPPFPGYWSPLFDLTNQTALILGTAEPVGVGIATAFADFGARVAVAERDLESAKTAARAALRPGRAPALAMNLDPARPEQVRRGIGAIEQITGGIDILVIVVSLGRPFPIRHGEQPSAPPTVPEVVHLVRATARRMAGRGGGQIVLLAAGVPGDPAIAALAIGGLNELVKTMASSFAASQVCVNAVIVPWLIERRTDLVGTFHPAAPSAGPDVPAAPSPEAGGVPASEEQPSAPSVGGAVAAAPGEPGSQPGADEPSHVEEGPSDEPPVISFPSGGTPTDTKTEDHPRQRMSLGNLPLASVVGAVLLLASPSGSMITGQTITVGRPLEFGAAPHE